MLNLRPKKILVPKDHSDTPHLQYVQIMIINFAQLVLCNPTHTKTYLAG